MKTFIKLTIAAAAVIPAATASAAEPTFGGEAGLGYRYDSNVGIAELDTSTGTADRALAFDVAGNAGIPLAERLTLDLRGGFSQTRHRELSAFDLGLWRAGAELAYRSGELRTGIALRHFGARLDGDRFLDIRQVSPNVARLFGDTLYVRAAYTRSDKRYAQHARRDAANQALGGDAWLLFDGMDHYLAFGLRADTEDAADPELDYDGARARITYGRRFEWTSRGIDVEARLQREARDYDMVTETIAAARRDERWRASLGVTVPVSELLSVETQAKYADVRSNLDTAAYTDTVLSVSLLATF